MRLVRTAWGLLVASPARLVVLVAGSVAVALAASSVVLAASSSLASVRATVDAGWRGSYDILVLPPDFELRQVDGRAVVPANYLGARTAGMTREQWETVSAVPDVDVAAPVATLGWVRDVAQLVEMLPDRDLLRSEDIFRVTVNARIGREGLAQQEFFFAGHAPSEPYRDASVIPRVNYNIEWLSLGAMPAAWTQVVGVDPVQENRLVGLRSYADGGYLTRRVGRVFDAAYEREAVNVPVLLAETATPGWLRVRVDRVSGVTLADAQTAFRKAKARAAAAGRPIGWREETEAKHRVASRLVTARGRVHTVHDARAPLSRFVQPLSSDLIQLTPEGRLLSPDDASGGSAVGRDVVLVPGYDDYESTVGGRRLGLAPVGSWSDDVQPQIDRLQPARFCCATEAGLGGDEALYRELTVDKPRQFVASPVGSYDLDRLAGEVSSAANYVPLGVYAEAPRRLIEDAQGQPTDRVLVSSPFNPGGLNPPPPTGLTNLATVEALRGPRFIDAIRVRVGGIAGYSPQALTRIENVAGAIVERTGLQVVVVAGSSPVEVEVEVPGVGVIAERWTTLGTVAEIVNGAQGTSGVLLAAALGVAIGYLLVAGVFVVVDQRQSLAVLTRLGWRRRTIRALVGWQAAMLGAASGLLAVLALGGLRLGGAAQLPWWSLAVVLGGVLGAHVLATVVVAAASAATRRRGQRGRGGVRQGARPARGVSGLAWRHAVESPLRLIGVAVVVAVAVSLAAFVAAAVVAFGGRLQQTVLGELVAVRIGGYHVLAAGAAMFAAAAIALYVALLAVERRVALLGLLRALGWRARQVRRLITVEAAAPVLAGGLLGMLTAAVIGALTGLWQAMLTVAAAGLILTTAVAAAALRAPVAAALRMAPGITLRAEGATGAVPALATRATLAVLGVLTLGLGAATLGWSAARPTAIPTGAFITPPAPTPPSAAQKRIEADVKRLAGLGERSPGSPALTQARTYAKQELEQAGYTVAEEPFVTPRLTLLNPAGRPVLDAEDAFVDRNLNDPEVLFPNSLAYHPDVLSTADRSYPVALRDATSTGLAGVRCTAGAVVLRVDNDTQAVLAHRLLHRCAGRTVAVTTVEVPHDRDWAKLRTAAVQARLTVERHLIATTPLPTGPDTPMLVATLESTGPGAAQSAAPVSVALEAARSATDQGLPLNVALIVPAHGEIATLVRHQWETQPAAPLVFLGPMGSDIPPAVGTAQPVPFDAATVRTTLLSPIAADPTSTTWINATGALLERATSPTLLDALADHTGVPTVPDEGPNFFALTIGLDAAYLGEPPSVTFEDGIAGTSVDTPDQIDYPTLTRLAAGLATLPGTTAATTTTTTPSPTP